MKDRRLQILFSIINSYILEGDPVGSKSLASDYSFDVSPATIRNDMSSLEKSGLLKKAHTSSGRLPSDKGYRYFVNYLLENEMIVAETEAKVDSIRKMLGKESHNTSDIVETATKILAAITNLTAVSVTLKKDVKKILNIELMKISDYRVLLIVVFDNSDIMNETIGLESPIDDDILSRLNIFIKKNLIGEDVADLSEKIDKVKSSINNNLYVFLDKLFVRIKNNSKDELNRNVKIEGIGNIFNFKEFDDLTKAKEFIKLFDSKEMIRDLLSDDLEDKSLVITIGEENPLDQFKENTIITSYFAIDKYTVGKIGVVGLTRINYREVIGNIKLISDLLSE
ncbi:heat-inducible transcriptional repressor HrcA [Anaerococcus sp. AGMB09787]|uniref:heat-inducible transcriptional repressor HrcA n=1 Tax=Anaerococcus sp. AGMB09787 TaxID=2922869 RepID=UPI001FAE926D|nr:heat-inducible transcriptional repressor HrcA [Anaerococcus sp. AGMB09787]